ncbi:hypothetical protein GCM10017044_10090 [Kordiimonas sediminis]|uniref:Lipoprotein n=1 Tax=Kordiimonas sediminis TaxID=1735581 RepID=A0A919AMZ2_9PROT|nr:hypothetical protein [Kordiimonas sediminis]GHF17666.1 hypothetical protein GCM10017044_10090 [Kordiimonas sediminis]
MIKFVKTACVIAAAFSLSACGSNDEDVLADYIAEKDSKYAAEADCIAEALTAEVGENQMKEWAEKIEKDGKLSALDLTFMKNLPEAAKVCLKD